MRFKVVDEIEGSSAANAEDFFLDDPWNEDNYYLLDTKSNEIVWADGMEPEDATLSRHLSPLVDLLNKVADGE